VLHCNKTGVSSIFSTSTCWVVLEAEQILLAPAVALRLFFMLNSRRLNYSIMQNGELSWAVSSTVKFMQIPLCSLMGVPEEQRGGLGL